MVDGLEARDEEYYLRKYIEELEPITDLIVLSVHEGVPGRQSTKGLSDVERTLSKDIDLAKNVPGVDIMITGHAHKGTPDALLSNETIIVSTNAYSIELGKLVVSYDTEKKQIVDYSNELITIFDDEIEDDPEMSKVIDYWESQVQKIALKEVSFTTDKMVRAYGEESNMGNLFADAAEEYDEKIDFAVINSGALRQDLDPGVLTKGDLISAFPFPNTLVMTKITGAQIEGLFDHAAGMTNGVLQVSKSFKYIINSNGDIKELRLNGKPINREKTYWVASTNFVTLGGDGYWEFTESIEYEDTNIFIVDVVEDYLKDKPRYSPVYEERIVIE
jgi:5'-nucleotidase